MNTSKVIWTTLPNGVRRKSDNQPWTASISLFITPRLTPQGTSGTLRDFPEWRDWPATMQRMLADGLEFSVQVHDDANFRAPVKVAAPKLPSSDAWQALLPLSTRVRSVEPKAPAALKAQSSLEPLPYSTAALSKEVERAYTGMFARTLGNKTTSTADPLQAFRKVTKEGLGAVNTSVISEFIAFNQASETRAIKTAAKTLDDDPDFHQLLSTFSAHPTLLRQLGLIIDLEIPTDTLRLAGSLNNLCLRVEPTVLPASIETHSFWTATEYGSASDRSFRVFCPAAETRKATFGFYALGHDKMTLAQSQVEHAAMALVQHASGDQKDSNLPRLVQSGMRILDPAIPAQVRNAVSDQEQLEGTLRSQRLLGAIDEPDMETTLFSEQLTRGYRIDVRDVNATGWRSLCERSSHYQSNGWSWPKDNTRIVDEGSVEFTAFENQTSVTPSTHVAEDLFSWDGWSLAVPRPDGIDAKSDASNPSKAPLEIDVRVQPGSLQAQRFGDCYEFRARSVDIAGNSVTMQDASALADQLPMQSLATPPTCCLRVESVLPPVVWSTTPRANEDADILVIRDAEEKRYRTNQLQAHIFPPQISVDMAERHSMFDRLSPESSWALIEQHQARLGPGEPLVPTDGIQFTPYLPDPLAMQGLVTLPDGSTKIELPPFDALPESLRNVALARSCLLTLKPGKNELRSELHGHELTLQLPKGRVQELTFHTKLSTEDFGKMALSASLNNPSVIGANDDTPALLAPKRIVRVVHASQRPLTRPVFEAPRLLARQKNQTQAVLLDDKLHFDVHSTGRLDVYANWNDVSDDPQATGWETLNHELHAGGLDIDDTDVSPFAEIDATTTTKPAPLMHDFGDTKHHEVRYRAVAVSRFVDLYPDELTKDPNNMNRISTEVVLHVPSTAPPAVPAVSYVLPTFRHEQKNIGAGVMSATQEGNGLRIYLERGWFSSGNGEQLALILATDSLAEDRREEACDWGVNALHDTAGLPGALRSKHIVSGMLLDGGGLLADGLVLVVHDVQFSEEHQAPFVDIEFVPTMTFMPLVRLVLARYQPHATEDCHLSPTTTTDFVPLAVDRALSIQREANDTWDLVVRGHSYVEKNDNTSVMQAQLEVLSVNTPEDAAAWTTVGVPITLEASAKTKYDYQWSGRISIDSAEWPSRRWHRRLVVAEYEPFATEGIDITPLADHSRLVSAHTVRL